MPLACINGTLLSVRTFFVHFSSSQAAYSPKHSGCTVSSGGRCRRNLASTLPGFTCQVRLWVIFLAPMASARLCADKHNNFIGLKGRACSNSDISQPTPLMQVTAANFGASGPVAHQSRDGVNAF